MIKRVLDPDDPLSVARKFIGELFSLDGQRILHHHDKQFYRFDGIIWKPIEDGTLRAELYKFLDESHEAAGVNSFRRLHPKAALVSEIQKALEAAVHLPAQEYAPPVWLLPAGSDVPNPEGPKCSGGTII